MNTIVKLNPWQVLEQLQPETRQRTWQPLTDISESEQQYQITLELAGVDPEQVTIEVEDNRLVVSGEKSRANADTLNYRYQERAVGQFKRTFKLPDDADNAEIKADFKHGLLAIEIPKREEAKPRRIMINSQR